MVLFSVLQMDQVAVYRDGERWLEYEFEQYRNLLVDDQRSAVASWACDCRQRYWHRQLYSYLYHHTLMASLNLHLDQVCYSWL